MEQDRGHLPRHHPGGDTAALAAAVAELRRRLALGEAIDLAALASLAADASHLNRRPAAHDMALFGLLDEIDLLVGEVGQQRAMLHEQLRALNRYRRAGSAYDHRSLGR